MGFGQGLSGLNAASQTLDVIGNNIANSGTVGFKSGTATFADVYANSRVGLGVQVASINQRFTVGTIAGTGNQFDMAIDGAKGMFRVVDSSDNILYTRNGQFFADKNNNIVNAQGQRLTGYIGGSTTPEPITVPVGNIAPVATSSITNKLNLDANAKVVSEVVMPPVAGTASLAGVLPAVTGNYVYSIDPTDGSIVWDTAASVPAAAPTAGDYTSGGKTITIDGAGQVTVGQLATTGTGNTPYIAQIPATPFDVANPDSYTHRLQMTVYDTLGNPHQLDQYFVKRPVGFDGTPANGGDPDHSAWEVVYQLNGERVADSQLMTFDRNGTLQIPAAPVTVDIINVGGTVSPAAPLSIAINYNNSTQFGGDFTKSFIQNGSATGEYASMSIAADGSIVANYTNGETKSVGTLVLADFNNLQGLQPVGGNAWAETSASGQPILGTPGTNSLATIKGQAVEESNVDMSQELVNMIIAQRTYQANAQTIKTQDQVLQTLINLR